MVSNGMVLVPIRAKKKNVFPKKTPAFNFVLKAICCMITVKNPEKNLGGCKKVKREIFTLQK
jgi:hypothetical protein